MLTSNAINTDLSIIFLLTYSCATELVNYRSELKRSALAVSGQPLKMQAMFSNVY